MSEKTEGAFSILAALLVLFSTMLDPRISMALAVILLIALGGYHLTKKP